MENRLTLPTHFRELARIEIAVHHLQSVRLCVSLEENVSIGRFRVRGLQLPPPSPRTKKDN